MAIRQRPNRTRTFTIESFNPSSTLSVSNGNDINTNRSHKQTHTYFNSDNVTTMKSKHISSITSLRMNIGAKSLKNRYPYSQHNTPITPQFTNTNKKFIDLKQWRNENSNKKEDAQNNNNTNNNNNNRLRLKQAQTDNYYNTTKYASYDTAIYDLSSLHMMTNILLLILKTLNINYVSIVVLSW